MYFGRRNFYHKDGKPRLFRLPESPGGKGWWVCKLTDWHGNVIGFGRARSMVAAYNAFQRDKKWRKRKPWPSKPSLKPAVFGTQQGDESESPPE